MSMIAVAHQSCGVMALGVAGTLLLIWHLRARARRSRAWKIQVRPEDDRYRHRAPAAAMPAADRRSPGESRIARPLPDDRRRARSRSSLAVHARRPADAAARKAR